MSTTPPAHADAGHRTGATARVSRPARTLAMTVATMLVAATGGCGPEVPPWAAAAEEYINAFNAAFESGYSNAAPFYAEDATLDPRFLLLSSPQGTGPRFITQYLRDQLQPDERHVDDFVPLTRDEPLYVSATGAVDPMWLHADPFIVHLATTYELSPDGITSEIWAGQVKGSEMYLGVPVAAMDPLAHGYLDAWASGDPDVLRGRYAENAVVRDSLAGINLVGATAIASAAGAPLAEGGLPHTTLHEIPGEGGPAYYLNGERDPWSPESIDWLVLLLSVDDGSGCPGDMAVALSLDAQQRVTHEERYHRVDTLAGCPTAIRSGWWESATIPDVVPVVRTGTMTLADREVAIWNGSPDPSPLIEWAVTRYVDAGLIPPTPTSVTFLPRGEDPWAEHGFAEGTTAPDLALPFPASEACINADCTRWPSWAKAAMLHQLAHLWLLHGPYLGLSTNPRGPSQATDFLAARDLPWTSAGGTWEEQGSQVAAEIIAWGLMDEPYVVDERLGPLTCERLADDFALLARAPANPAACAAREPGDPLETRSGREVDPYPPPAPAPWVPVEDAQAAVTWFDTYASALRQGLVNIPAFYAEDAVIDHRALNTGVASGRDAVLDLVGTQEEGHLLQRQRVQPVHLSAAAAVIVDRIATRVGESVGAFAMTMGSTGILTETYAPSLQAWRRSFPKDGRLLRIQMAAQAYRQAWSEGTADLLTALYAPEARLTDDLLGIEATGRRAVSRLGGAATGAVALPGLTWVQLPDLGGPGIFLAGGRSGDSQLDTLVLLGRTTGCPGQIAIVLHFDRSGLIDEETRLHSASDLARCPTRRSVAAWWEGAKVPPAVAMVRTGTLGVDDLSIEIFNGSPILDRFVEWGFARYASAGLPTPVVDRIRFLSSTTDTCRHVSGLNLGTEISVCVDTTQPTELQRSVLLHELGHAWMNANLGQAARERFMALGGKPTWASTNRAWGDRGVELAASTLSWALMDEPSALSLKLGAYTCNELSQLYEILVGNPLPTAWPCTQRSG